MYRRTWSASLFFQSQVCAMWQPNTLENCSTVYPCGLWSTHCLLGLIVLFTISVNSAPLRGWILVCQLLSYDFLMRILVTTADIHKELHFSPYVQIFGSVYGVWNLDFFRSVYKPFCLHPSLSTLQVMILDLGVHKLLYPFMDNILACYKDGTNGTRNCRYFSIVYHITVLAYIGSILWTRTILFLTVNASVCIVTGMLVAVIQPYKSKVYNTVDVILILSVGLCFTGTTSLYISYLDAPDERIESVVLVITIKYSSPLYYGLHGIQDFLQDEICSTSLLLNHTMDDISKREYCIKDVYK